ncbi:MAG: antibiotic biosynthesis monooxygenase [Nitrososphaerota archaeon]|jgi:heme-degrading monooxygenase HmoA|nr:antibiotic biosynthesis monooxygenase [Nitrososphaerota archaeon]
MINIGLYYRVKEGHEEEFERVFKGTLLILKEGNFGFLDGKLYRDTNCSREYLLYTEWEDIDSFRKFTNSKAYTQTVELGRSIIEGQPRHRIFRQ